MIEAWFDGCCEPINPGGHAAFGILIKVDGEVIDARGGYVGNGPMISNNVAEYAGLLEILRALEKIEGVAMIYGDSKLVINQMNGKYRSHGGLYVPWMDKAKQALIPIKDRVGFKWVPREENAACDELSKRVLHDMKVEFRIQPEKV